ncbi:unnamed protein product [Dibothriocephalus latus]|uniref:Transcription factor TFIIE alpha subunit C-terminal domain-containing protein n=1 Tax=Dibothriocephalus latus TaxID=60516 RepID=A0A3P7NQ41_DIBLA|nr:unnamed protein product [Dibothriocephalus latus]
MFFSVGTSESGKRDESKAASGTNSFFPGSTADYTVTVNGKQMPYTDISPAMVKTMNAEERNEYIRVGKKFHSDVIFD